MTMTMRMLMLMLMLMLVLVLMAAIHQNCFQNRQRGWVRVATCEASRDWRYQYPHREYRYIHLLS